MGHAEPTDQKGSIVETEIKIKPSKKLWDFIKSMNIEDDIPRSFAAIIGGNGPVKTDENRERKKVVLTKQDLTVMKSIISENLTKDKSADIASKSKGKEVKRIKTENLLNSTADKTALENDTVSDESNAGLIHYINTADLEWLYNHLNSVRKAGKSALYLHELVQGSEVVLPQNQVIKRNAQLEERCKKLRSQQDARDYRAMTKSVDNVRKLYPEDTIAYQMKHMNRQLISIGQFIISVGAGFLFGFLGVELMIGNLDFGFRLLLGVMCALIIALAEIYFLAKQLNEELIIPETTQIGGPATFQDDDKKKLHQE